ncbi:MAG TPA: 50S ribosomal protein L10 [Clostridiales bacterium]|nr:50S ribosomal protein L10 [Clostridiales bacterium]
MSASQEARKELAQVIKEKFANAKSVVFVKSNGLTVAQDTELRNEFRKNNVDYRVYKNTLIRYALHDLGIECFDDDLNGPTSVAFGADETAASKVVMEAAKKYDDKFTVKSAYVEGNKVDVNGVKELAAMPSKEELVAKMLGSLQAPITNFVGVLSAIPRGLVIALSRIAEQKA